MLQPLIDPLRSFTDFASVASGYVVFKRGNYVIAKRGKDGQVIGNSTDLAEVLFEIFDDWYNDVQRTGQVYDLNVVLAPGQYTMNQPFVISEWNTIADDWYSFNLIGSGKPKIVSNQGWAIVVRSTGTANYWAGNVTLMNLTVACNHNAQGYCIDLTQVDRVIIFNIDVAGCSSGIRINTQNSGDQGTWIDRIRIDGPVDVGMMLDQDPGYVGHIMITYPYRLAFVGGSAQPVGTQFVKQAPEWLMVLDEKVNAVNPNMPVIETWGMSAKFIRREYCCQRSVFIWQHPGAIINIDTLWDNQDSIAQGYKIVDGYIYRVPYSWTRNDAVIIRNLLVGSSGYKMTIYDQGKNRNQVFLNLTSFGNIFETRPGGVFTSRAPYAINSGYVTVPAGGTYTVSQFTVPSNMTLTVHQIIAVYNPSGNVSAQVVDLTANSTVVSSSNTTSGSWQVSGGDTVAFQLVNSNTSSSETAWFIFIVAMG